MHLNLSHIQERLQTISSLDAAQRNSGSFRLKPKRPTGPDVTKIQFCSKDPDDKTELINRKSLDNTS